MKTFRFPAASIRTAAVLLVCLLLATSLYAGGRTLHIGKLTVGIGFESKTKELSAALAPKVEAVQTNFKANRQALQAVKTPKGSPVYPVQAVTELITRTGADLDQAMAQVGELEGLRAWSTDKLQHIQADLNALPVETATVFPGSSTPRAVAVVASLEWLPLPAKSSAARKPASKPAPKPTTKAVPADASDRLLNQVGEVVDRIFFLASHDDLEVKLWIGSTPAQKATFRFWTQGQVKWSTQAPTIIQTNGKKDHVLRGLYAYHAALSKGSVTEVVQFPAPAGTPAAGLASEQLDLVTGSSFFCCRFKEQYCQHVASEKECHP